jgi:hypothetical protein
VSLLDILDTRHPKTVWGIASTKTPGRARAGRAGAVQQAEHRRARFVAPGRGCRPAGTCLSLSRSPPYSQP